MHFPKALESRLQAFPSFRVWKVSSKIPSEDFLNIILGTVRGSRRVKTIRISLAKLVDVHLHDCLKIVSDRVSSESNIPKHVSKLLSQMLLVKVVPLKNMLLDQVRDLSAFSGNAECSIHERLSSAVIQSRGRSHGFSLILVWGHSTEYPLSLQISSSYVMLIPKNTDTNWSCSYSDRPIGQCMAMYSADRT
nr:MAG TPA: hypothetical protein [Caudoviricetes sp.]